MTELVGCAPSILISDSGIRHTCKDKVLRRSVMTQFQWVFALLWLPSCTLV